MSHIDPTTTTDFLLDDSQQRVTPKLTIIPPPDIDCLYPNKYDSKAISRSASPSTYRASPIDIPDTPISQFDALRKRYLRTIWDWNNYLSDATSTSLSTRSNIVNLKKAAFSSSSPPPSTPLTLLGPFWSSEMIYNASSSIVDYINAPREPPEKKKGHDNSPSSYFTVFAFIVFALVFITTVCVSFFHLQNEPKYCRMSYMTPSFHHISSFDKNYTRLSSKYSLFLYREHKIDTPFDSTGIPVIFIPGNAGSYRQVRALAAASSSIHDSAVTNNPLVNYTSGTDAPKFDYFTVDFQEDLTAFHGRSLYDQAEYLNDAIAFILKNYNCYESRNTRPESVILIGHSMGGMVARAMLTLDNYQKGSVNTIFTLSAPHTLPPVSFDGEIVKMYDSVNRYWEQSFSQDFIGRNPLASVSVISVTGGSLDHMIPSEHASISAIIPPSNGFTVHANSIPHVWAGIDHQAIVWCDQFRQIFASALNAMVDLRVPAKTKPLPDRMEILRKHFLGGFDVSALDYLQQRYHPSVQGLKSNESFVQPKIREPDTFLWIKDVEKSTVPAGQKVVVKDLGAEDAQVYLMPIPKSVIPNRLVFSLLTDNPLLTPESLETPNLPPSKPFNYKSGQVPAGMYAMVCRYPQTETKPSNPFLNVVDLTRHSEVDESRLVGLLCKNLAADTSKLPKPSYSGKGHSPPSEHSYLSYLHYDVSQLVDYDFFTIVDTNTFPTLGFATAEFSVKSSTSVKVTDSIMRLFHGVVVNLPASRPTVVDISYKNVWSSLLAFKAQVIYDDNSKVPEKEPLFTNFIRQYSGDNYDSRYYLNLDLSEFEVSVFGVAPFTPFGVRESNNDFEGNLFYHGQPSHYYHNLHLQLWSDNSRPAQDLKVVLKLDIPGSLGKLVLHYRVALVTFPIAITALVLLVQFRIYANEGVFIDFMDGLHIFVKTLFLPLLLLVTILPYVLQFGLVQDLLYVVEPDMDFMSSDGPASIFTNIRRNQFFLGLEPGHVWFLGIAFICVAVGFCFIAYYAMFVIVYVLALPANLISSYFEAPEVTGNEPKKPKEPQFPKPKNQSKVRLRRIISLLLIFIVVAYSVPYEFAYIVACLVQISTAVRYCTEARTAPTKFQASLFNLVFSILMIMFWIAPISTPMLAVWFREVVGHGTIVFRSHHNLLAVGPIVCFVELMSSGCMLPRPKPNAQTLTTMCFLAYLSIYALLFGIPRAYKIHHLLNVFMAWLVFLYVTDPISLLPVSEAENAAAAMMPSGSSKTSSSSEPKKLAASSSLALGSTKGMSLKPTKLNCRVQSSSTHSNSNLHHQHHHHYRPDAKKVG